MSMTAKPVTNPIAGLAAAPTVFGTNLYLRPATGVHLPTFAEQALVWNAQSTAPAERIVINAQQWNAAPSLPSTDAEQLSRLAHRFQTMIDLKTRSGVQEFVSSEERSRQEATGSMEAEGEKKLPDSVMRDKIRRWLLTAHEIRSDYAHLGYRGNAIMSTVAEEDHRELADHLIALGRDADPDVRGEAAIQLHMISQHYSREQETNEPVEEFNAYLIHELISNHALPDSSRKEIRELFQHCAVEPSTPEARESWNWWGFEKLRDVFIRVLNDPEEAKRKRARDFFDAHEWIKDARSVAIKP